MNLKVLVIGLGSMGKRRIRNLQALKISDIYGYDVEEKTCSAVAHEYKINIIENLKDLSQYNFDFAVISTPPQYHLNPVNCCIKNGISFFSEFNLITKDALTIAKQVDKAGILGIPSNTTYYDTDVICLKKELSKKDSGYFVYQLGQNINDWHPWQKPGEHFIFYQSTNGIRELLRTELPWLIDIFGPIKDFSVKEKNLYTGKFKINDFLCLQLEFRKDIQGIIIFDLISSYVIKRLTMVSNKETIIWDERNNSLNKYGLNGKSKEIYLRDKTVLSNYKFHEDAHRIEMKNVLKILNKKNDLLYTFHDEANLLKLIDDIEKYYV